MNRFSLAGRKRREPRAPSPTMVRGLPRRRGGSKGSGALQVDRAGLAALIGLELVGDAIVLVQGAHAGLLDRADINEGIVAATFGRDETVARLGVEKFDLPNGHGCASFLRA